MRGIKRFTTMIAVAAVASLAVVPSAFGWVTKQSVIVACAPDGSHGVVKYTFTNAEPKPGPYQHTNWNDMSVNPVLDGNRLGIKIAVVGAGPVSWTTTVPANYPGGSIYAEMAWVNPHRYGTDATAKIYLGKLDCRPPKPNDKIVFGQLTDGAKSCETKTVTQTRTKSVTTFVWNGQMWVEGTTTVTTETSSRPMTEAELKECSPVVPPPVCVSPNVKATMTVSGVKRVGYLKFFTQRITLTNNDKYTQRHTITLAPQSPRLTFGNGSTKPKIVKFTLKPGAEKSFPVGLRPTKAAFRKWVFFKVTNKVKPIAPKGVKFCSVKELKLGVTRRIWEP